MHHLPNSAAVPARSCMIFLLLTILLASAAWADTLPAEVDRCPFTGRFPAEVMLESPAHLDWLVGFKVDLDRVQGVTATVYVDDAEFADLRAAGFEIRAVPNLARRAWAEMQAHPEREQYHTPETLTTELQQIAADYPAIAQLESIGASNQGREIWMMKISDNVQIDEPEPEFKYTATMHGDEVVGMEMCVYLIRLLVQNYGIDPELTALVDDIEIFICPLHNPDGTAAGTRYNALGQDLNRTFPDPVTDPFDDPTGRPTEVQHMMRFQYDHNILLGINYHGGALVMNYPWDSMAGQYTPDNDMIRNLSLGYSYRNPPMWNSPTFPQGVTIGWEWYVIHGGMQDWCYYWRNEINITGEISNVKWPSSSTLPGFWDDNRDAMLWFMSQVRIGVEGFVTDAVTGDPLMATYDVVEIGKPMWGESVAGYYHRLLEPGTYTFEFSAFGYEPLTVPGVVVAQGGPTPLDAQLTPTQQYQVTGVVTEQGAGIPLTAQVAAYRHDNGELFDTTTTDAQTGAYTLALPAWEYDLIATADGHVALTETRTIDQNTVVDFALLLSRGDVLVVMDGNASSNLATDLADLGFMVTNESASGTDPGAWGDYDLFIWSAGQAHNPISSASLRSALESFVAGGGKLLIEGGEVAYDALVNPGYPSFASGVLHVSDWDDDQSGPLQLRAGMEDHPLATIPNVLPTTLTIIYDDYGDQDAAQAAVGATVVYGPSNHPNDAGILVYEVPGRSEPQIVFFAFDYAALGSPEAAEQLLENAVTYLTTGSQAISRLPDPAELRLGRPYPSVTPGPMVVALTLVQSGPVQLEVFDASGRRVRRLLHGVQDSGTRLVSWDGRDTAGNLVSAGVYFLRAATPGAEQARRLIVVE